VGVFFLVLNKDLDWLGSVGNDVPFREARRSILIEVGFIAGVALLHVLNIIYSYTRNLKIFFGNENRVLTGAAYGDFQLRVPVSTNDEFGIMARYTNEMVIGLKERTEELQNTRDVTINALASLAETRDNETGAHILRTQNYVRILAEYLGERGEFPGYLTPGTIEMLFKSAPLHDIGKVGIPDAILLKPGKLTDEEFKVMKRHSWLGANALKVAEERLGSNSFLRLAGEIALTHHEKWDGTGYPRKLSGYDIPLSGRLMAIADVYDALITRRIYKEPVSHEETMKIIGEGKGGHFDPMLVDAFFACEESIRSIAGRFTDN
jgi:response regulator RpfG family c-di-GMP phosphodiesterase